MITSMAGIAQNGYASHHSHMNTQAVSKMSAPSKADSMKEDPARPYPKRLSPRQPAPQNQSWRSSGPSVSAWAIYEKMSAQIVGLRQGASNAGAMTDLIRTAEVGLSAITDNLQRVRELSLQASNGTLTDSQRNIIQNEIGTLMSGINDISVNTEFNNMKLLNGQFTGRLAAISPNGGGREVSIGNMSLEGLDLMGYNVTGHFNVGRIDNAIHKVTAARSNLGTMSNSFGHAINSNVITANNMQSARNRLAGTNLSGQSSQFGRNQMVQQYQLLMQRNDLDRARHMMLSI